jgi:putative oxidoreductase
MNELPRSLVQEREYRGRRCGWHEGYCGNTRVAHFCCFITPLLPSNYRKRLMTTYSAATEKRLDQALLVLRLVLGAIFIVHGYQKVFGFGISGVTASFTQMGVPLPAVVAPIVAVLELAGGIALLFGAFTRVAAFLLACDMLGAIILVHAKNGFSAPKGVENVLGNFAMLVAVALLGAGAYSIDALLARRNAPVP